MSYIQKICYIYIHFIHISYSYPTKNTTNDTYTHPLIQPPLHSNDTKNGHLNLKMDSKLGSSSGSTSNRSKKSGHFHQLEVGRKPYPTDLYTGKKIHPGRFTTAGT